ncbi:MAG: hypothetical protein WBH94_09995, partial [Methanoculleus sp.]
MKISLLACTVAALFIGTLALLTLTGAGGIASQEAPAPITDAIVSDPAPIEGIPEKGRSVTSRLPEIPIAPKGPTWLIGAPAPDASESETAD